MKDKKLQIFVSSTYTDLKEERQAAVEAILSSGHIPAGMELFTAGDESQMTVIERWIDESDVYLLILGGRYGSIDKNTGKSYTHLEYEYAVLKQKPLFAVVINDEALDKKISDLGRAAIEQEHPQKLKEFREIVKGNLVKFWSDSKDIKIAIHETVSDFIYRKELTGWVRGDDTVNTAILAEEIARLTKENAQLRKLVNETNTSTGPLFSGLTYHQLKNLLIGQTVDTQDGEFNLFDLLLLIGPQLASRGESHMCSKGHAKVLVSYKLIYDSGINGYRFTEDGHRFYMNALVNQ